MDNRERFILMVRSAGATWDERAERIGVPKRKLQRLVNAPPKDLITLADRGFITINIPQLSEKTVNGHSL